MGWNSSSGSMAGVMQAVFPLWVAILFPCINLYNHHYVHYIKKIIGNYSNKSNREKQDSCFCCVMHETGLVLMLNH